MTEIPITHQINNKALELLNIHPNGIRWTDLNSMLEKTFPDFHPKTINGCVWKLIEKYPEEVFKPEKGLFKLLKYKK
jgi:Mg2+/Co2+ transporter CorB